MVGLESMQGIQREFQTICLTKLSNTCRQTQVQAGGERSEPPLLVVKYSYSAYSGKHSSVSRLWHHSTSQMHYYVDKLSMQIHGVLIEIGYIQLTCT